MSRIALLALLLVVAMVAPIANAQAQAAPAPQTSADASADTLGSPPIGFVYAWGRTRLALHSAVAHARARGYITVGGAQYGWVLEAGGYAWWVRII